MRALLAEHDFSCVRAPENIGHNQARMTFLARKSTRRLSMRRTAGWTTPEFAFNASLTGPEAPSPRNIRAFFARSFLPPDSRRGASLGFSLAGCVDTVGQAGIEPTAAAPKIARREGVSPHGASVALTTIDGAPQQVADSFSSTFAQVAPGLDLATQEPKSAAYLVRGYLSAYPAEQGVTRFSYVFDVFDQRKARVARLSDDIPVKGAAADPWMLADAKLIQALAERSAGDLADALTNTPEAVAGAAIASAARSRRKSTAAGRRPSRRRRPRLRRSGPRLGWPAAPQAESPNICS